MTKKQIAEQVMRILAGGTPTADFPVSIREIMYAIEQERDTIIRNYLMAKFSNGEYSIEGHLLSKQSFFLHLLKHRDDTISIFAPMRKMLSDIKGYTVKTDPNGDGFSGNWMYATNHGWDASEPLRYYKGDLVTNDVGQDFCCLENHDAWSNTTPPNSATDPTSTLFIYGGESWQRYWELCPPYKIISPITLENNRGIHKVSLDSSNVQNKGLVYQSNPQTMPEPSRSFVPLNTHVMGGLFWNGRANQLEGRCGYWVSENRIYFQCDFGFSNGDINDLEFGEDNICILNQHNNYGRDLANVERKIEIWYVAASRDIEDNENLPLAADMQSELIKSIVSLFGVMVQTPEDTEGDNIK